MVSRSIYARNDFQKQVVKAVEILAGPVKSTLGPDGVPILLQRADLPPLITKDGVTVANSVFVDDPALNLIIDSIKEVAMNTNSVVGDGTTTAILLTESIIKNAQPYLQTRALTPQILADQLLDASKIIAENLSKQAIKINSAENKHKVKEIALVSCNGDDEIASVVSEAIDAVGVDGSVTLAEGHLKTTLEIQEGFSIERGFGALGQYGGELINQPALQQVRYDRPAIAIFDGNLEDVRDLYACLNNVNCGGQDSVPLVIFAHDFDPRVIQMVLVNAKTNGLQCFLAKVPKLGSTHSQSNVCEDIAVLTGGIVIKPGINKLADILNNKSEFLGGSESIVATEKQTTIYNGAGSDEEIKERAEALKHQMANANNDFDKGILRERLGRLVGGIAVIYVGAQTDLEMKEKKDRIEDALNATKVALSDGIIPGGGTALLLAYNKFFKLNKKNGYNAASEIFRAVCQESVRQIVSNSGKSSPDVIVNELVKRVKKNPLCGFNARTNRIEKNMIEAGVIDPVKVVKTAFLNAVSIAVILLRSGGSIVFNNKKESKNFYINEDQNG